MPKRCLNLFSVVFLFVMGWACALSAASRVYTLAPDLNIRARPDLNSKVVCQMPCRRWVASRPSDSQWTAVDLETGRSGFVAKRYITSRWIKVWKAERKLFLMSDREVLQTFRIGLGFNPHDDKIKQGDGCTPLGRFYVCEMLAHPKAKYGARSMRISYPNLEDARRGLQAKRISRAQYLQIVKQINMLQTPLQTTPLGGSIRIHGGGSSHDWTLGCIGMDDADSIELYSKLPAKATMVEIYQNQAQDLQLNQPDFMNAQILKRAKELLRTGCQYTREATAIIKIDYPMGDFNRQIGVCTDVAIRALRGAGADLQALLFEDILLHPDQYPTIGQPNPHIDHRRTRNLKIWFDRHALKLSNSTPTSDDEVWRAGDIVIMDTGVPNGTIYDHIGVVSDGKIGLRPLVINLWTIGCRIDEMDLLGGDYPKLVGHYRLTHPFDYAAALK